MCCWRRYGYVTFTVDVLVDVVPLLNIKYVYELYSGVEDPGNLVISGGYNTDTFTEGIADGVLSWDSHRMGGVSGGLVDGFYTVLVRVQDGSNCVVEGEFEVLDDPFIPVFASTPAVIVPESSCRVSDGSVSLSLVDAESGVVVSDYSGYNIMWYSGGTDQAPSVLLGPPGFDVGNNERKGLSAGSYAVVIETPGECRVSGLQVFQVPDGRVDVGVDIEVVESVSACRESDADGVLLGRIVRGGVGSDFGYSWVRVSLLDPPLVFGAAWSPLATGVEVRAAWEGRYGLRVTHAASGCVGEAFEDVVSTRAAPVVSVVSVFENTHCVAPWDGRAELRVDYGGVEVLDFVDFGFVLDGSTIPAGVVLEGLSADEVPGHVVEVSRRGCVGVASVLVGDNRVSPDISGLNVDEEASRSCDEDLYPSGRIEVRPDGTPDGSGYSYAWYNSTYSSTAVAVVGEGSNEYDALRSGFYSVLVRSVVSGCEVVRDFTIDLVSGVVPSGSVVSTPALSCVPPDGRLEVVLGMGGVGLSSDIMDYDWSWYAGLDESELLFSGGGVSGGFMPGVGGGLLPGWYSVRYTERETGCSSVLLSGRC